jgi:hypothetical protein
MAQSKRAKVANYLCRLNFRSPLGSANKINVFADGREPRPTLKPPFQGIRDRRDHFLAPGVLRYVPEKNALDEEAIFSPFPERRVFLRYVAEKSWRSSVDNLLTRSAPQYQYLSRRGVLRGAGRVRYARLRSSPRIFPHFWEHDPQETSLSLRGSWAHPSELL